MRKTALAILHYIYWHCGVKFKKKYKFYLILKRSCILGHDKIAHILLDNGADIHSRSSTGKVARDYALARGMMDSFEKPLAEIGCIFDLVVFFVWLFWSRKTL